MTKFNIIHYHSKCAEIVAEISKRVCERSEFISPTDSEEDAKAKLALKFNCSINDMCNTCPFNVYFASWHKDSFYLRWLDYREQVENEYYSNKEDL